MGPIHDKADERQEEDRPDIRRLLDQLVMDSRAWADAELRLAQVELAALKRQAFTLLGCAALAAGAVICVLITLSQAGVAALRPYTGEPAAQLVVCLAFALVSAAALLAARRNFNWRTESLFFRWLGTRP